MHRSRRLGLPVQASQHAGPAGGAARLAAPVKRCHGDPARSTQLEQEKVNILVVDDLPEKHVVFRSILEELGQNIVSARSGQEALRYILEKEFAVILLDVNMPDIDGLETAGLIRQYKKSAQTPIVFITAYVDEVQAKRGYALGAVDYIPSPVVPEVLRSKVRVFVELFRMNRQLQVQAAAARSAGPLRSRARGRRRRHPSRRLPGRSEPAARRARSTSTTRSRRCSTWRADAGERGPCWR